MDIYLISKLIKSPNYFLASEDFFDKLTVEQEFMSGIDTDKVREQLNCLTNSKYCIKHKAIATKAMALTPMSRLSIFKSKCKMKIQLLSVTGI